MDSINLITFNNAATACGLQPIGTDNGFRALRRAVGDHLADVVKVACNGGEQGSKWLSRYVTATRFLEALHKIGFDRATFEQAFRTLIAQGPDRVRDVTTMAMRNDGTAKRDITQWLLDAASGTDQPWIPTNAGNSPQGQSDQRTQSTPVLSSHNRSMPPPGAPTGQARRADEGAAPRSPTPRTQERVASAHQAAARQDGGDHGQGGRAPQRATQGHGQRPNDAGTGAQRAHQRSQATEQPFTQRREPEPSRDRDDARDRNPSAGDQPRVYESKHVYGGRAALCFEATTTQAGSPTVQIEAAPGQNKVYKWKDKLIFQLTTSELQLVCSLLYGHINKIFLSGHNDKWLSAERQQGQYAGTIKFSMGKGKSADNQPRTVQVSYTDLGEVHSLFVRQTASLLKQDPVLVERIVRQVAQAYTDAQAAKGGNNGGQGQGQGGSRPPQQQGGRQHQQQDGHRRYANG
ncbi:MULTISPECIES: hypothetical protein [unclassified Dyella]|uniref:hypothetical protein n=1 Tax=Dyella sp. ASV21 TaxID=2795114 RepID=UPI0018EADC13|nr:MULTISPECIES: hypothetical protein [unclassified Dyella]